MYPKLYYVDSSRVDNVENHKSARPRLPTKAIIIASSSSFKPTFESLRKCILPCFTGQKSAKWWTFPKERRRTVLFKDPHSTLLNILGTQLPVEQTFETIEPSSGH